MIADPHYHDMVTNLAQLTRARRLPMRRLRDAQLEQFRWHVAQRGEPRSRRRNDVGSAMTGAAKNRNSSPKCRICFDDLDGGVRVECGHTFCKACINEYVKNSLQVRSSFPPECCMRIFDVAQLRDQLDEDVLILVDAHPVSCARFMKSNTLWKAFIRNKSIIRYRNWLPKKDGRNVLDV